MRAIFFVGIFGNETVMKTQLEVNKLTSKYMIFLTLLYDWAHGVCNGSSGKTDILLIKFDEYQNKFTGDEENARKLYDNLVRIYKTGDKNESAEYLDIDSTSGGIIQNKYLNYLLKFINDQFADEAMKIYYYM